MNALADTAGRAGGEAKGNKDSAAADLQGTY